MTDAEIVKHKLAARKLDLIKDRAFVFIKNNLGKISEYDVNKFVIREFKKENLITDKNYSSQIVAANKNTSFVHYFPAKNKSGIIEKNCLILLDIWAKLRGEGAPFADITWMAYAGKEIPTEIKEAFNKVIGAREFALEFIRRNLRQKELLKTVAVDGAVRKYFGKMKKNFAHGLGHSLGFTECHGNHFRFGRKSRAKMKSGIPFTIEPGLYFPGKFGIRSEINCYVTKDFKLEITTKVQKEIVKL